jgi:hypothetical protein
MEFSWWTVVVVVVEGDWKFVVWSPLTIPVHTIWGVMSHRFKLAASVAIDVSDPLDSTIAACTIAAPGQTTKS